MRNNKRWIAVTVLAGVTAAALVTSVLVKNNMNKGPANAIELTQEAKDSGIKSVEVIKDDNGNVTGYKVNVDAKGFGEPAMDLMITFNEKADTVVSLEVISQNETEGLGSNVTKPEFLDQFNNVKLPVYIEGMDVAINEIVETFSLASFEATTVSAPAFVDGTYEVVADEAHNGWLSKVTLTVENGAITNVVWDCENEEGKLKSVLSQNGEYKMTDDGAIWADQAKALADYVVANQGLEGLTMDENGKTDAVATVSISINEFVSQVETAMKKAAGVNEEVNANDSKLVDGTYEVVADEAHNGWLSKVTLTVENGAITNVVWDCENEEGKLKSVLSQNGEYKMTDDGAIWADQAKALADYVVANQGLEGLTMDENGKTDAVATVSISINEFVSQVETALRQAAGEEIIVDDTTDDTTEDTTEAATGTQVDAISGATVTTKAVLNAINNAYEYLINNVVE